MVYFFLCHPHSSVVFWKLQLVFLIVSLIHFCILLNNVFMIIIVVFFPLLFRCKSHKTAECGAHLTRVLYQSFLNEFYCTNF